MNFLNKIVTLEKLTKIIESKHNIGQKVALCHGTFDLLHPGHLRYFQEARSLSDLLVVTVTPDRYVIKGPGRPIYTEALRLEYIASIEYIDFVTLNNAPDAIKLIKQLAPDFYVKGSDYKDHSQDPTGKIRDEVKSIESVGGTMYYTDNITFSSSELISTYLKEG